MSRWFPAGAGALAVLALVPALTTGAAAADSRPNRGLVELETGTADGIGPSIAQDLASLVNDGATRRLIAVLGDGGTQNLVDLQGLRGIDLAIVTTDALDEVRAEKASAIDQVTFVTKLYPEQFQLLAGPAIKTLDDLAGKKINVSGGSQIVARLDLKAETTHFPAALALRKLAAGEIAAAAFLGADPARLTHAAAGIDGLHLVPVPLKPGLGDVYAPASLAKDDYPGLVGDAPVDTIAVGTVLAVASLPAASERYRNVVNVVEAFFTNFPTLLEPGHQAKWREVNLAADVPGMRRFAPAQQWLARNAPVAQQRQEMPADLRAMFESFLDQRLQRTGSVAMTQQEKDALFGQFVHWQAGKTR